MVAYIADEVENLIQGSAESTSAELLVGVYDGYTHEVKQAANELNATETTELPFNSLRVIIPAENIDEFACVDGIESIELDEGMEILAGN
jgi:hypothetical protein